MAAVVLFESASELATLTNTFKVASVATDPTTISLAITTPAGVTTTYTFAAGEITKTSTGIYTKDIACSEDGEWGFVWTGTGTASDVVAGTWHVFETTLGRLYVTVDALKSRLGITASDTTDDFELHGACFAASRWVESYCQRTFWRTATGTVRTFVPDDPYLLRLGPFNDLVSLTALATDGGGDGTFETTWLGTDWQLLPHNPSAAPEQRPYTKVRAIDSQTFPRPTGLLSRDDRAQLTGAWGWPAVPYGVKAGSLIVAAETFKAKDTFEAAAGMGEWGPVALKRNPQALDFLKPYRLNAVRVG